MWYLIFDMSEQLMRYGDKMRKTAFFRIFYINFLQSRPFPINVATNRIIF